MRDRAARRRAADDGSDALTFEQAVILSAIAGLTIYLGLPVGRIRGPLDARPRRS